MENPVPVTLQTDWFPQPEHGGFYQALAKGFYEDEGLDVTILPGGPNAMTTQKVLMGKAHFAMNRADTIYTLAARKVPVVMVMATLQHDPQGLLMHTDNPVNSFDELDGKRVMAIPGLTWISWIEAKYDIQLDIIPHDFGMERFLNDTTFIQQCLITNEPYYVGQAGAQVRVMPLRESGFDPYHGIYCLRELAEDSPDLVEGFIRASVKGWTDFILNDPTPAFDLISALNPKMTQDFMEYSHGMLKEQELVTGIGGGRQQIGQLDSVRLESLVVELIQLEVIGGERKLALSEWVDRRFLPRPVDVPDDERP